VIDYPSDIDPQSAVGFWTRRLLQRAYDRPVLVRSILRHVKGRKRRKRFNYYRTIRIPARYAYYWSIEYTPPPKKVGAWIPLTDFEDRLRDLNDPLVIPYESYFRRRDPNHDVVNISDGFIWYEVPDSLTIEGLGGPKRGFRGIRVVRIWFIVHHRGTGENLLWSRARIIPLSETIDEAYEEARKIYDDAVAWTKERNDAVKILGGDPYLDIRDMVAWTCWLMKPGGGDPGRGMKDVEKWLGDTAP
jgi:hypothetical protein